MPQNIVLLPCSAVGKHPRVGQKTSDLNSPELPHLEGVSRVIVTHVTRVAGRRIHQQR